MTEKGSTWGAKGFSLQNMNFSVIDNTLISAVKMLHAKTKQAFYGAILRKGVIKRRTWDGCAFNAGSLELGDLEASSFEAAAAIFGESPVVVRKFIHAWDSSKYATDEIATQALMEMLEEIGIFTDPDSPTVVPGTPKERRIVIEVVHESTMSDKELLAEFADVVKSSNLDNELEELFASAEGLVMV